MKTNTDNQERIEQLKAMQAVALSRTEPFARPVVIGDIVDELNKRAKSYECNSWSWIRCQERALFDFQNYIHEKILEVEENDSYIYFRRPEGKP